MKSQQRKSQQTAQVCAAEGKTHSASLLSAADRAELERARSTFGADEVLRMIDLRNRIAEEQEDLERLAEQALRQLDEGEGQVRLGPHVVRVQRELAADGVRRVLLVVNGMVVFRRELVSVAQPWRDR